MNAVGIWRFLSLRRSYLYGQISFPLLVNKLGGVIGVVRIVIVKDRRKIFYEFIIDSILMVPLILSEVLMVLEHFRINVRLFTLQFFDEPELCFLPVRIRSSATLSSSHLFQFINFIINPSLFIIQTKTLSHILSMSLYKGP